jgi:WD40 repeat protein
MEHAKRIKAGTVNASGSIFYTAPRDTTVKLWDVHHGVRIASIEGHTKGI